jgi:hypothetical protein
VIPLRVADNCTEYQERSLLDFGPICGESLPDDGQDKAELAFGLLGLRRRDILVA